MADRRTLLLTAFAMLPLAANSLLCRMALAPRAIDAASFTSIRLLSGAIMLWLLLQWRTGSSPPGRADWRSAAMLFLYAAAFSFAYLSLSAGTGALILFGFVQLTMLAAGFLAGERLPALGWLGLLTAVGGLVYLMLPGLHAPDPTGAALMATAGIAWGIYSLRGRGAGNPLLANAGNFARSVPLALLVSLLFIADLQLSTSGILLAVASGALASAIGYAIWYAALPGLSATSAATVQLSVPVIASLLGILLLSEPLSPQLVIASVLVLGGIALVLGQRPAARSLPERASSR
jgi:drug/metabolite transporter (DMT)-like permease